MNRSLLTIAAMTVACAFAQNPLSTETKGIYTQAKTNIIKSAEKMPEENYSFKPTPEVRSFAGVLGHVADSQYLFCSPVKGEKKDSSVEKTKTSKADLVAALKDAFAYCDAAYDSLTDANGVQMVKFFGRDRSKLGTLNFNN